MYPKCYTQFSSSYSSSCPFCVCVCVFCVIFVIPSISLLLSFDKVSFSPILMFAHRIFLSLLLLFAFCVEWMKLMGIHNELTIFVYSYQFVQSFSALCVYLCYWFNIWSHFDSPSLTLFISILSLSIYIACVIIVWLHKREIDKIIFPPPFRFSFLLSSINSRLSLGDKMIMIMLFIALWASTEKK